MIKMFPNGYIVQQIEECPYHNIWRRCTWPLELYEDVLSVQLSDEADEKWFGYNDGRPLTIPSKEYIHRYTEHCRKLGINYIILFVESTSSKITTNEFPSKIEALGYDLSAGSLDVSLVGLDEGIDELEEIRKTRNKYGYIQDRKLFEKYISIRKGLTRKCKVERLENEIPFYLQLVKEL